MNGILEKGTVDHRSLPNPVRGAAIPAISSVQLEKHASNISERGEARHGELHRSRIVGATIMEQHGHPPLLLDLESVDKLDHVLFLYNVGGRWGTIGKSRDAGLHGRKPVFKTVRDLVLSYVEPYVDATGRICGYGVSNLNELTKSNWRLSERNVWVIEKELIARPRAILRTSDAKHRATLERFLAFKQLRPDQPYPYRDTLRHWL